MSNASTTTTTTDRSSAIVDGFTVEFSSEPDLYRAPDPYEYAERGGWITPAIHEYYNAGEWEYVDIIVTAKRAGVTLGTALMGGFASGTLEYGRAEIDPMKGDLFADDAISGYGPQMIAEALSDARATLARLATPETETETEAETDQRAHDWTYWRSVVSNTPSRQCRTCGEHETYWEDDDTFPYGI